MSENNQKNIFLKGEADQYYSRNKSALYDGKSDFIIDLLRERKLTPLNVLEVGCSNGWRLSAIHKHLKSDCYGIDPSLEAINEGSRLFPNLTLKQGTADFIPFFDKKFDLIIFGFCLYLCDRRDLFKIVYEADQHLEEDGYIVILDFEPPAPFKNKYRYKDGIYSFKMNYAGLFLANPGYFLIYKSIFTHYGFDKIEDPNERISLTLIRKRSSSGYFDSPYT